jgi:hypothetical protein
MEGNNQDSRKQQREKNLKIIREFPFLLAAGEKRHLLTDNIIISNAVKKVDDKEIYFCLERSDLPLLSLFNLERFTADILVYYQSATKINVIKIHYWGTGGKLAQKILTSVPEECQISNIGIIDNDYILHVLFQDIIIYRNKSGDLRPIIKLALNQKMETTEPTRNHLQG